MVIERSISVAFGHDRVRRGKSRVLGRKVNSRGGCSRGQSLLVNVGRGLSQTRVVVIEEMAVRFTRPNGLLTNCCTRDLTFSLSSRH